MRHFNAYTPLVDGDALALCIVARTLIGSKLNLTHSVGNAYSRVLGQTCDRASTPNGALLSVIEKQRVCTFSADAT